MDKSGLNQRRENLRKLLRVIQQRETAVIQALQDDFGKPGFEAVLTETFFVMSELKATIRNMHKWAADERVRASWLNFPSTDWISKQPYGTVLVISPWNYPFHLAMLPAIAAYAAGNSVILKPSELTPNTSQEISTIMSEVFNPVDVEVFQGGKDVAEQLLQRRWDYIFFTGSVNVGRQVAIAAAKHLTPATLELGGKNPCIVTASANLKLAARRIVWGKFLNAGQTCIAPDYLVVEASAKSEMLRLLKLEILRAFGPNPEASPDLARIIDDANWLRLTDLVEIEKVVHGGQSERSSRFIAPTLIDETDRGSKIMDAEIFGPLLPVLAYSSEDELEAIVKSYEKPLSLYVFSSDDAQATRYMEKFSFGGGCINDTMVHFANSRLPFGGVGDSGIGSYHGRKSFDTFVHRKAIVKKATWLDIPLRYAPYRDKAKLLRKWLTRP